jgi:GGDEF domain-containing protein
MGLAAVAREARFCHLAGMSAAELAIWSAASGAIALVVVMGLLDWALSRRIAALHGALYNAGALLFVLVTSGIAAQLLPPHESPVVRVLQVVAGPLCALSGDLWIRTWFGARQRDRLMDHVLLGAGLAIPSLGVATLFVLPTAQQLPVAAGLVVLNTAIVTWISVRAWLLGDALALGIAIGSVAMMVSVCGLYAIALGLPMSTGVQAALAVASALCVAVIGIMLWQRNQHARRVRRAEDVQSQYDAVTKLPGGVPLVRNLLRAQKRRRLTVREGAVIAVLVFEPERIRNLVGNRGLNEAYVHLAQRLQHQVSVVNPVGRYWERCFVALIESIRSPAALRTLGLRVATSLRRPMEVKGADGGQVQLRLDIGVGVLRLEREHAEVEDLLHEAQQLAEAARAMPSRAATRDPVTGDVVPVELAQLGPRRTRGGGFRSLVPRVRTRGT